MDKENAIEWFTMLKENFVNTVYEKYLEMAIKALDQTMWIPVSERLPKEGKTVIASSEYGVYPETRYTKEYGWEWAYEAGADYWRALAGVTAWMPLPERYKKEVIE